MSEKNEVSVEEFLREAAQAIDASTFRAIIDRSFTSAERESINRLEELLPRAHQLEGQLELF